MSSTTSAIVHLVNISTGAYLGPMGDSFVYTGDADGETVQLPPIPEGTAITDSPPTHPEGVLRGFTVTDGAVVGGTWDYSAVVIAPNVVGFLIAAKNAVGGAAAANALAAKYPDLESALMLGQWDDAATLIELAKTNGDLTSNQYTGFGALLATYHIPVTLS